MIPNKINIRNPFFVIVLILVFNSCHKENDRYFVITKGSDNTTISTEIKNGSANGRIIVRDSIKRIVAILHVKDSVLVGDAYGFYPNGRVSKITEYKSGVIDGRVYEFNEDGSLSLVSSYTEGEKNGYEYEFHKIKGAQ